jgi:pectin methylesterase-like acyl-CoA thioesterase
MPAWLVPKPTSMCWMISHESTSGRPWNDLATTVYLNTTMDKSVNLQGFTPWGAARPTIANTTFYAEYNSSGMYRSQLLVTSSDLGDSGEGYDAAKRLPATHILTAEQAKEFTVEKVFGGKPRWVDWSYNA